jgi:hypothetical protein
LNNATPIGSKSPTYRVTRDNPMQFRQTEFYGLCTPLRQRFEQAGAE